jgi:DnaJ family protein B protein 12
VVSKAFQVLSDPDKKMKFDKFGGDPDSRHQQAASSPFGGFARSPGPGRGGSMFEDEISPEELFRQFFGGGLGGGFPGFGPYLCMSFSKHSLIDIVAFDTGPQFVFNMGGPGIRVTQFGGGAPRRRPRPGEAQQQPQQQSASSILASLLPLLLLFLLPLLSSIFSGSGSVGPTFTLDKATPPYTKGLKTRDLKVPYWVNPSEYRDLSRSQRDKLERRVEVKLVSDLNLHCEQEERERQRLVLEAQGWWTVDERKMDKARKFKMPACERLQQLKKGI